MAKPADFFVGVTDMFSIVLPGTALAFVIMRVEQHAGRDILGLLHLPGKEGYVAFVVIAFLLGHLTDMVGASILDGLYDLTYADWKDSWPLSFARWLRETPGRLRAAGGHLADAVFDTREREDVLPAGRLARRAKALADREKPPGINVYKWSLTWITLKSSPASTEIERMQANSKFFRGIVAVCGVSSISSFVLRSPFTSRGGWACLFLTCASFLRYCDLRWKAVQQAYAFFVALQTIQSQRLRPEGARAHDFELAGAPREEGEAVDDEEEDDETEDDEPEDDEPEDDVENAEDLEG